MFNQLNDALVWLETQIKFKPKSDLDRMNKAFQLFSLDLAKIKKVHVAGTNGKGSVASFISHILIEAGFKVATYTSPYLVKFNERIMINFIPIDDHDLLKKINEIYIFNLEFSKTYGETLSFFELLTLMALSYFNDQTVDIIIMEVGLGGLLDATNILNYDLSLITSIGFDHMKQLGNTLESIAFNKLGILKESNTLITTVDPSLHTYFKQYSYPKNVKKTFLTVDDVEIFSLNPIKYQYQNTIYEVSLKGSYQVLNSLLAVEAAKQGFKLDDETIKKGLKKAYWPARMEKICDYPTIYLDAAHNTHAIKSLVDSLKMLHQNDKINILFCALGDKDIFGMLALFKSLTESIVLTKFPDPRFIDYASELIKTYKYHENAIEALNQIKLNSNSNEVIVITGSLHFVGYMKKHLV
jgi:dihydrofolate synthase / folylpolyglutamate synthase